MGGRACNGCSMCCYLPEIEELKKPADTWCKHCTKHSCAAYDLRPRSCREFICSWLYSDKIPDYWYPKKARMVLYSSKWADGPVILIHVDTKYSNRWRERPYYDDIKYWSAIAINSKPRAYVHVFCGKDHWFILPDKDIYNPGYGIVTPRGDGLNYDYSAMPQGE